MFVCVCVCAHSVSFIKIEWKIEQHRIYGEFNLPLLMCHVIFNIFIKVECVGLTYWSLGCTFASQYTLEIWKFDIGKLEQMQSVTPEH